MSENLDLVRSIYADWERGDYTSAAWADPEIEYRIADGPTPGSWKGLDGLWEGWREWLSAWEEVRAVAIEFRALDDERVLVLHDLGGRGTTSGLDLGQMPSKGASVFRIRAGKVTKLVDYFDCARAFADLGLEE